MYNEFRADLELSEVRAAEPWVEDIYREYFPDFVSSEIVTDLKRQKSGIDRIVHLADGASVKIEEKFREKLYPDFLLETYSIQETLVPGWMVKHLDCDYLAYVFVPTHVAYVIHYPTLFGVFAQNRPVWEAAHGSVCALNKGYRTRSIPVPIDELIRAVPSTTCIKPTNPTGA